jgi:hypothetical protein
MTIQQVTLSGNATGVHVLRRLPDLGSGSAGGGDLLIETSKLTGADAFTGLVARAAIEWHLASDSKATACNWEPCDSVAARRLHAMLGPMPERAPRPEGYKAPSDDRRILIPVTSIEDDKAKGLAAAAVLEAGSSQGLGNLRMSRSEAYFLGATTAALLDNALAYSHDSPCAPFVCCSIEAESRDIQLAVLDFGRHVWRARDPLGRLRGCLERSETNNGGLTNLLKDAAARGLDVSMEIRSGSAFARWHGGWERREVVSGPGWVTGILVRRPQRRS